MNFRRNQSQTGNQSTLTLPAPWISSALYRCLMPFFGFQGRYTLDNRSHIIPYFSRLTGLFGKVCKVPDICYPGFGHSEQHLFFLHC